MIAQKIAELFRGRTDVTAVATSKGFEPENATPTVDRIEREHLGGKRCLGFYLLDNDSKCFCSAVDFDNKEERPDPAWRDKAERLYFRLVNLELSPLLEISQSGNAAHVWLFFSERIDSWLVRAWWREVFRSLGDNAPEIYPKQDRLKKDGIGNLIRYPLWGESRFVDVEADWETIDPLEAMQAVRLTNAMSLKMLAWELGCPELKPETTFHQSEDGGLPTRVRERVAKPGLLSRRWFGDMSGLRDGSRSALVQSIACELVRTFVPTPEIEASIKYWCDRFGYDKGQRDSWVRDTVSKAYEFVLDRSESRSLEVTTIKDVCLAFIDQLEMGGQRILPSGIEPLDNSIDGASYGEMVVIAAMPSHGKSAVAMQWLDNATARGEKCLILSEEMSKYALAKRSIQYLSPIPEVEWERSAAEIRREIYRHYDGKQDLYIVEN
jgi:hypothetical protein